MLLVFDSPEDEDLPGSSVWRFLAMEPGERPLGSAVRLRVLNPWGSGTQRGKFGGLVWFRKL